MIAFTVTAYRKMRAAVLVRQVPKNWSGVVLGVEWYRQNGLMRWTSATAAATRRLLSGARDRRTLRIECPGCGGIGECGATSGVRKYALKGLALRVREHLMRIVCPRSCRMGLRKWQPWPRLPALAQGNVVVA